MHSRWLFARWHFGSLVQLNFVQVGNEPKIGEEIDVAMYEQAQFSVSSI